MRNITTITIPVERFNQLKAIGSALNLSTTETIAHLIRREVEAGTIPATLSGVEVERLADGVSVRIGENEATSFGNAEAIDLADAIQSAASGLPLSVLDLDRNFAVERRGNGVKVSVPFVAEARAFTRDVAEDVATLIRKAAQ